LASVVAAVGRDRKRARFDARQFGWHCKQRGALHADADDAKRIGRLVRLIAAVRENAPAQENCRRSRERASSAMEELDGGKIFFSWCAPEES